MKKKGNLFLVTALSIICFSCEMFSVPLFRSNRNLADAVGSMSTEELAENIDKITVDPNGVATVLDALSKKDKEEILSLSVENREAILSAGVSAVLPMSQVGDMVEKLTKSDGETDFNSIMDSLSSGATAINPDALNTILGDQETLEKADVSVLALSAASLIVSTIKNENSSSTSGEGDKMMVFQEAVKEGGSNPEEVKKKLKEKGFSDSSVDSLSAALGVTQVLTGTGGTGQPNRKDELENVKFGGMNMGNLLDSVMKGEWTQ